MKYLISSQQSRNFSAVHSRNLGNHDGCSASYLDQYTEIYPRSFRILILILKFKLFYF